MALVTWVEKYTRRKWDLLSNIAFVTW